MIGLGGIECHEGGYKGGGADAVDLVQVVVHGDQQLGADLLCKGHSLFAVKVSDDIVFIAEVVTAVDGEQGNVNSLNASVALGIAAYEVVRNRLG